LGPARRGDLIAAGVGVVLVAAAAVVGVAVNGDDVLHVNWPPLSAVWEPHADIGTPLALVVGASVVAYGPSLARRLPWRAVLVAAWVASMAWIWSLALVDGWKGVAGQLETKNEYLRAVDRFADIPKALRGFTSHILIDSPGHWPAHVAGHPPGATLTFVALDRIGLGGGTWAAAWCITVGASAAAAVLIAVSRVADESLARRAAPFAVLVPAAVWTGVSADGYFAGVAAWTVAMAALAAKGSRYWALGCGLLYGLLCYLSYGLTLFGPIAVVAFILARLGDGASASKPTSALVAGGWAVLGALVVPAAFTVAGFWWWEGYQTLVPRYYQGYGGDRPQWYFVWANLACTVIIVGLATVAGLRRAAPAVRRLRHPSRASSGDRLAWLVLAALAALLLADLSGMSKAETERIWLPFAVFLLPATALLPARGARWWLGAQAVVALAVNHLLVTSW
jgi:hypothetical protein